MGQTRYDAGAFEAANAQFQTANNGFSSNMEKMKALASSNPEILEGAAGGELQIHHNQASQKNDALQFASSNFQAKVKQAHADMVAADLRGKAMFS